MISHPLDEAQRALAALDQARARAVEQARRGAEAAADLREIRHLCQEFGNLPGRHRDLIERIRLIAMGRRTPKPQTHRTSYAVSHKPSYPTTPITTRARAMRLAGALCAEHQEVE